MSEHANSELLSLSPLDGRYRQQLLPLRVTFSEFGLTRYRVLVELSWFQHLSKQDDIGELPPLSDHAANQLQNIVQQFSAADADAIKQIERKTNHDVKAVEYWVKNQLRGIAELAPYIEFVHFACTSEDINNLAYALMLKEARESVVGPALHQIESTLNEMAHKTANVAMMARTHGQPASPTTVGKEVNIFRTRLARQRQGFEGVVILGKFNGAVGNFNAHLSAYPGSNWLAISRDFVESLGLVFNPLTTQIESHDWIAEYAHALQRCNQVLLDLARDFWGYIAIEYFKQKKVEGETGSSVMPHKVNPIDFENAEGNIGIANALLGHLAEKLTISRWQRDLSDSTALRNLGVALGHALLAYKSLLRGLDKVDINQKRMTQDLDDAWEILSEAVQTVMRRHGLDEPYERLKALTRGQRLDSKTYQQLVRDLELPSEVESQLLKLKPRHYLGAAAQLATLQDN